MRTLIRERLRRGVRRASTCIADADHARPPAFALGEKIDDPLAMYLSDIFTAPSTWPGLPAVALPCGLDARGLPLSLQLIGRPFAEATCSASAAPSSARPERRLCRPTLGGTAETPAAGAPGAAP